MKINLFPVPFIALRPFEFKLEGENDKYVDFFVSEADAEQISKSLKEGVVVKYFIKYYEEEDGKELVDDICEIEFPKDIREAVITRDNDPNINEVIVTIIEGLKLGIPDSYYDSFFLDPENILIIKAELDTEEKQILVELDYYEGEEESEV